MAKKRKQLTELQQQYQKQIKRLKQAQRRAEKKGYEFEPDIIPEMPKRVTKKALTAIQQYKTKDLYSKGYKLDRETGELVPALEARAEERKESARKAKETKQMKSGLKYDYYEPSYTPQFEQPKPSESYPAFSSMVIQNFKADMSRFPEVAYPLFIQWLEELQANYSDDDIATMLEEAKGAGLFPDYAIAYDTQKVLTCIADMMDFLPDASEQFKKDLAERLEYGEDWELPD